MKMLKKAAAVLMAAAISLTLLTACGGGSGAGAAVTGNSYTIKMSLVEENGRPVTRTETQYITTNGEWLYWEGISGTDMSASLTNTKSGEYYIINLKNNKAYKGTKSEKTDTDVPIINDGSATATTKTGTWEYNKKTYATKEIIYVGDGYKATIAYCYDGATLVYIKTETVYEDGTDTEIMRVNNYSTKADESKFDTSKYTLVDNVTDIYK